MKNIVRAFVIALALTGAVASAHTTATIKSNPDKALLAKSSAFPIPTCPPDDPEGCDPNGGINLPHAR
jgi:hypothetical protein